MFGLVTFCLGAVVCAIGSRLPSGRYYKLIVGLGGVLTVGGVWLAFFGFRFFY
jgi:hypothetical protein